MKADIIIKNARIFTADRKNPAASALAVRMVNSSMWVMRPVSRIMKARPWTLAANSLCPASSTATSM